MKTNNMKDVSKAIEIAEDHIQEIQDEQTFVNFYAICTEGMITATIQEINEPIRQILTESLEDEDTAILEQPWCEEDGYFFLEIGDCWSEDSGTFQRDGEPIEIIPYEEDQQ